MSILNMLAKPAVPNVAKAGSQAVSKKPDPPPSPPEETPLEETPPSEPAPTGMSFAQFTDKVRDPPTISRVEDVYRGPTLGFSHTGDDSKLYDESGRVRVGGYYTSGQFKAPPVTGLRPDEYELPGGSTESQKERVFRQLSQVWGPRIQSLEEGIARLSVMREDVFRDSGTSTKEDMRVRINALDNLIAVTQQDLREAQDVYSQLTRIDQQTLPKRARLFEAYTGSQSGQNE